MLFKWIGIFAIFGGTFFALTDAGYQCIVGYGCEDVWKVSARLFLTPQVEMAEAIDLINQKTEDGTITEMELNSFRKQIIASILITLFLFIIFFWLCTKSMTTLNATDLFFAALAALMLIAIIQVIFSYILYGQFTMPFIGFYKLMQTPYVLIGVINYSEILPLNQTINGSGS